MSFLKITPELFLEVAELMRQQKFLDADGFRKNILENSVKFGLIKSNRDIAFANGRVERDIDNTLGQKTVKIRPFYGINNLGEFPYMPAQYQLPIPGNGNWYWIRVSHAYTNLEKGVYSIASDGSLTCTDGVGELTKVLRGIPNFPSRVKFFNSTLNTLEYDVLEVIDDNNAILQHPGVTSSTATFNVETNLQLKVVGTFTPGVAVSLANKYPFNYDWYNYEIIQETILNTRPTYTPEIHFYLARVRVVGGQLIIQDKRTDFWETKGSELSISIEDVQLNPLIGIEAIKWNHKYSPSDKNLVEIAWGMRSNNWTIDSSNNILTLNSALGGKFKSVTEFTDGDLDGWRLYTMNGNYSRIVSSTKQGAAINLQLDVLDIDDYSIDGGITFQPMTVLAVPNTEEVELKFTPINTLGEGFVITACYPVNTAISTTEVLVYDNIATYNVQYRYKSFKEYTEWENLPCDNDNGYLTEVSFTELGILKPIAEQVRQAYCYLAGLQFLTLQAAPWSYYNLLREGVWTLSGTYLSSNPIIQLIPSQTDQYISIAQSSLTLANDVYFNLDTANAQEGDEFRIHINCNTLNLDNNNIFIGEGLSGGVYTNLLKTVEQSDIYEMMNQEGGIVFTMKFDDLGHWIMYQNYGKEPAGKIVMLDGVIASLFNTTTKMGKVRGLYGYSLCDGSNGTPNLLNRFIVGAGDDYTVGATGGANEVTLTINQMPSHDHGGQTGNDLVPHTHDIPTSSSATGNGEIGRLRSPLDGTNTSGPPSNFHQHSINAQGGGMPHENLPPYYALIYAKKLY